MVRLPQHADAFEPPASVRIVRDGLTPADSAWGRARTHTLVDWPAADVSTNWRMREPRDSIGAVEAGLVVVVAPLARRWEIADRPGEKAVARWMDGEAAATEASFGDGCIRRVAIGVPAIGDLVLRPEFTRLLDELAKPCDNEPNVPLAAPALAMLAGTGMLASAARFPSSEDLRSPAVPWFLAFAMILAFAELLARRDKTADGESTLGQSAAR